MAEPRILVFLCNWCANTGVNPFEGSEANYPPNFRIIRVICSGSIDPTYILTAFEGDSDGVLVTGCQPGKCHYQAGNFQAKYKVLIVKKILKEIGLDTRRLRAEWISPSDNERFRALISEFSKDLKSLDPVSIESDPDLKKFLSYGKEIISDFRLRWLISRARNLLEIGNAYGEKIPNDEFEGLLEDIIDQELLRVKILNLIKEKGLTANEIASKLSIPTEQVMEHLVKLNDEHKVTFSVENHTAVFIKAGGGSE